MASSLAALLLAIVAEAAGATWKSSSNPLDGKSLYVNPTYAAELEGSIATANGTIKSTLESMRGISSAYWLDQMWKVSPNCTNTSCAAGILADAAKQPGPPVVTMVVYDVPNRDCHAKASNGEICCNPNTDGTCNYDMGGDCSSGLAKYQNDYIDPFTVVLKKFCNEVPIVLVVEPDSLPNLASNQADPHCGNSATTAAYSKGIPYAVKAISQACPAVSMYLDAAHGGWLGWQTNLGPFTKLVEGFGITDYIRGFSTNVANYQPLGIQCPQVGWCLNGQHQSDPCCSDPCKLESQYNAGNNEHNYVAELAAQFAASSGFSPRFLIDTGRNGQVAERSDCANWCNIRGAGVGLVPTTNVANSSIIDAYMWLKTPGESDGCTASLPDGSQCTRYDSFCGSADSIGSKAGEPRAPLAGKWFDYQVKSLAANANMGPTPPTSPSPMPPSPPPPSPPAPPNNSTCTACGYACDAHCNCGRCNYKPGCDTEEHCLIVCNGGNNAKWCGASPGPAPGPPNPPPNPSPSPPSCPGGSLSACMALCPSTPPIVYKDCVAECTKRCTSRIP